MPATKPPVTPIPQSSAAPASKCSVEKAPNGGLIVHFLIDEQRTKRIKSRAQTMDLAAYIWNNIINPAVEGSTF